MASNRLTFIGNGRSPGDKLQQTESPFVVEFGDGLPKPRNHGVFVMVAGPRIDIKTLSLLATSRQPEVEESLLAIR